MNKNLKADACWLRRLKSLLAVAILGAAHCAALADVYTYIGADHVIVLTNLKPQGQQVEILVAEPRAVAQYVSPGATDMGGRRTAFNHLIAAAAKNFSIESALLHAVISVESDYVATARSVRGASGLMQLMPYTGRAFGADDLFDPGQNINAGARYLRYLLDKYNQKLDYALAAYNAGEEAVARHGGRPPPFRETLRYVELVRKRYLHYRDGSDSSASPQ